MGAPIVCVACHCDDCQEGSRQIEQLTKAAPVLDSAGGTAYVLFRKDRVMWAKGSDRLENHKLKPASSTNRVVASCCHSAMALTFDDGRHWVSVFRARMEGASPPLAMRLCAKYKPEGAVLPNDAPAYGAFPLRFIGKLIGANVAMAFGR